ncbi:MAG: endonuclease III domain-containing protein [Thermodesulfovibrionales bacterium]|nr:endonuclease III domain-containing protein [Thermodesulfovibrionales bacterium]
MQVLSDIYRRLFSFFGPQHWWPGDTPFEIAVGAILTQNTNWGNVEKAIQNLRQYQALTPQTLHAMSLQKLAELIRPAGYYNIKAKRLKSFMHCLMNNFHGSLEKMKHRDTASLREMLLSVNGIGPETADSILLYALGKPVFVIDAYTKRVLARHGISEYKRPYEEYQALFHGVLRKEVAFYNEYHALFVKVGKTYCNKQKPQCEGCPLEILLPRSGAHLSKLN